MKNIFLIGLIIFIFSCGDTTKETGEVECTSLGGDSSCFDINTQKLIGTPFEGLTLGDSLNPETFLCGQYRTSTIDSFPVLIFVAFGADITEAIVQEGIDIANEAVGFEAYAMTDTWSDDVRVIYFVDSVGNGDVDALAGTYALDQIFDGLIYSRRQSTDWAIQVEYPDKWIIAHELGHASGIQEHALIDYENNTLLPLEGDALMEASLPADPVLTDYNYMMSNQGLIMQDHLGEEGLVDGEPCE